MSYPEVDPLNWQTVQPEIDWLLKARLGPEQVEGWLQQWSDLATMSAAASGVPHRAVSENTADKTAEERFLHLIEEILPKYRVAEQALRDKLLGVRGYTPAPETRLLWRRFQAEANLFRAENVPIEGRGWPSCPISTTRSWAP